MGPPPIVRLRPPHPLEMENRELRRVVNQAADENRALRGVQFQRWLRIRALEMTVTMYRNIAMREVEKQERQRRRIAAQEETIVEQRKDITELRAFVEQLKDKRRA